MKGYSVGNIFLGEKWKMTYTQWYIHMMMRVIILTIKIFLSSILISNIIHWDKIWLYEPKLNIRILVIEMIMTVFF